MMLYVMSYACSDSDDTQVTDSVWSSFRCFDSQQCFMMVHEDFTTITFYMLGYQLFDLLVMTYAYSHISK